jgi:futalosine hydrolase
MARLLVVAATERELAPVLGQLTDLHPEAKGIVTGALRGVAVACAAIGVGKARAAAGLAWALAASEPRAVLLLGIGGAYLGSFLSIGHAVVAESDTEIDLGIESDDGFVANDALRIPLWPGAAVPAPPAPHDAALAGAIAARLGIPIVAFATQDRITSDVDRGARIAERYGVSIESMEGAAAAAVAARWGVAFAQVRVISNVVGERDRARWDIAGAIRRLGDVAADAVASMAAGDRSERAG